MSTGVVALALTAILGEGPTAPLIKPIQLRFGQLRRTRDLAAIQPQTATFRTQVNFEALKRRPVEDRIALHAAEIGCFRHGQNSTSM